MRTPRASAAARAPGGTWRRAPGVPWNHSTGRPAGGPYSAKPMRRPSLNFTVPSTRGAGTLSGWPPVTVVPTPDPPRTPSSQPSHPPG